MLTNYRQYRLTWKREGLNPKHKKYRSMKPVERMIKLLGPEPWTAHGRDPDDGMWEDGPSPTIREYMLEQRKNYPPIEYIKVTSRMVNVTPWKELQRDNGECNRG